MTTQNTTYHGWANYATWDVALWFDNDAGTYNLPREMARDARSWAAVDSNNSPRFMLSNALKKMVENDTPDLGASMFADLLNAALGEVDWDEIAANILSES